MKKLIGKIFPNPTTDYQRMVDTQAQLANQQMAAVYNQQGIQGSTTANPLWPGTTTATNTTWYPTPYPTPPNHPYSTYPSRYVAVPPNPVKGYKVTLEWDGHGWTERHLDPANKEDHPGIFSIAEIEDAREYITELQHEYGEN